MSSALLYNNVTRRPYPHRQQAELPHPRKTTGPTPPARLSFTPEGLQVAPKNYHQVLDVSVDDLEALFRQTERHAFQRRSGATQCGEIMSRDILAGEYATELADAWQLMHAHAVQPLPVIDRARRVIGIVTRSDFLQHADSRDYRSLGTRLRTIPTAHCAFAFRQA